MSYNTDIDPNYEATASAFLKKTIAALVCAAFPIASIVAIFLGAGNHRAIVDYVNAGGLHTGKIKTCAALSKAAIFAGIGMTIVYAIYIIYFVLMILAFGFSALPNQH